MENEEPQAVPQQRFDRMYGRMDERVSDLEGEAERLSRLVEDLEQRVRMLEQETGTKMREKHQKYGAIVEAADNVRDAGQEEVALKARDVKAATGVSRRYSYDLIDDMGETVPFCAKLEKEEIDDRKDKPKRLVVSFNGRSAEDLKHIVRGSQNGAGGE